MDVSIYKKVFPLLLVLALFNKNAVTFTHLDSSSTIQKQLKIMLNVFDVLEVEYQQQENELLVFPKQIQNKKQLDCQKDPYIAIVLSLLAVISKTPLIIKNCQCIDYVFEGFIDKFKILARLLNLFMIKKASKVMLFYFI